MRIKPDNFSLYEFISLRNCLFFLFLISISVFIQSSTFNFLAVGNIQPNLALIIACYVGLHWGEETGTSLGFFTGLLQDVLSAGLLGLNALSKTIFGYLCGKAAKRLNIKNVVVQIILVGCFSLLEGLLFLLILQIFHLHREVHETFLYLVFPQTIYNVILTPIIFGLISFLRKKWII